MPSPETKPSRYRPYQLFVRPVLFRMDPEFVHDTMLGTAQLVQSLPFGTAFFRKLFPVPRDQAPVRVAGIELANPIGMAAGFDKNGVIIPVLESVGFGFVEVGTVTPRPQLGNPRPRLQRVPDRRAIVNRMGFNNDGMEALALNVRRARSRVRIPIGINLGKNRDTPNSEAHRDYELLIRTLNGVADYFVINISSPNTPGLRDLQSGSFITTLSERIERLRATGELTHPVFVKLGPDLGQEDLQAICGLCGPTKAFAGLILTNTQPTDLGGLSGAPLKSASVAALKAARALLPDEVPVISVGGIETAQDVLERFRLGAAAVELYTALIYQGPAVVSRILHGLGKELRRKGIRQLVDLREA